MKGEFYKFDFDAWDEGTVDLTLEQEAAYLRVCNNLYRRGGSFPNSERLLCQLWRCHPNKAKALLKALVDAGKVQVVNGVITNKRASEEIADRAQISATRAEAGRTGGLKSGQTRRTPDRHPTDTLPTPADHLTDTRPTRTHADVDNLLIFNDTFEAFASKQTNQRREEERRDSGSYEPAQVDPKKDLFDRGKAVLGKSAGGMIGQLLDAKAGDVALARAVIETASTKAEPREYVAGAIRARAGPAQRTNPHIAARKKAHTHDQPDTDPFDTHRQPSSHDGLARLPGHSRGQEPAAPRPPRQDQPRGSRRPERYDPREDDRSGQRTFLGLVAG